MKVAPSKKPPTNGKSAKFVLIETILVIFIIGYVCIALEHPIKIDKWQVINLLVQIVCMTAYYFVAGWTGIVFLLLSIFIAGGLHPIAGHFIAEHYIFKEGQETYSYYGFLNKITFNVGYHNEHHDFPNIPGSRLPELKKMASAHYDNLYAHDSWTKVLWHFVTSQKINLFSRVKRNQ